MNRRLSLLCVALLIAGAVLFATGAWAGEEVTFSFTLNGLSYVSGVCCHYPVLDISVEEDIVQPAPYGFVRAVSQFQLNAVPPDPGRVAFITAGGDVLLAKGVDGEGAGWYPEPEAPDDPNRWMSIAYLEYIGGTGPFAGVRGTGRYVAHHRHLTPLLVSVENAVFTNTLHFADSQPKMVPVKFSEGALVGDLIVEPESFPMVLQEVTHSGLASHGGTYLNAKRFLVELDPATMSPRNVWGFFTKTFANGDTVEGYGEGTAVPSTLYEGASEVSLQVWMLCGTGRFENASGKEIGTGTIWPDGREMLTFEGLMSTVGSSMD